MKINKKDLIDAFGIAFTYFLAFINALVVFEPVWRINSLIFLILLGLFFLAKHWFMSKKTFFFSLHAFWLGGLLLLLLTAYSLGWFYAFLFIGAAFLVLYRRIVLKIHTFSQIFWGFLLGILVMLGIIAYV